MVSSKTLGVLRTFNIVITISIVALIVFIILAPSFPAVVFAMNVNQFEGYAYQSPESLKILGAKASELPEIPADNRIVIPKIYVNAQIKEGDNISLINTSGMLHIAGTSTPEFGGNTVIAGHRYVYANGPDTFYNLDKVSLNDLILVYWKGKEYVYKVYEITTVDPSQVQIEYNTVNPILTLFTCTPLWTSINRLVVKANLQ